MFLTIKTGYTSSWMMYNCEYSYTGWPECVMHLFVFNKSRFLARDLSTHLLDALFSFWTPWIFRIYYRKDTNWTLHYYTEWVKVPVWTAYSIEKIEVGHSIITQNGSKCHIGQPISKSWLKPWTKVCVQPDLKVYGWA